MKRKTNTTASDSKRINREANNVNGPNVEGLGPSFDDLPSPISTDILLRLPMKSLLICRCVCKSWRALISDPQFAESHFKNSEVHVMIRTKDPKCVSRTLHLIEFEPSKFAKGPSSDKTCKELVAKFKLPLREARKVSDKRDQPKSGGRRRRRSAGPKPCEFKVDVVNSCNGFLCLCDTKERNPLLVCNPITGEFIRLQDVSKVDRFRDLISSCFGYHPRTNEYKVMRVYNRFVHHPLYGNNWWSTFAEIHTLGTGVWKSVLESPKLNGLKYPTYLNGALHWLCNEKESIVSFNFESDKFQSISYPDDVSHGYLTGIVDLEKISMGELKGNLYICDNSFQDIVQLWVMNVYGVEESWTKVFNTHVWARVPRLAGGLYKPIKYVKDNTLLIYHIHNYLTYFDFGKSGYKYFPVRGTRRYQFEAIALIPSLVSLKDAVRGDNVEVLNVNSGCSEFKLVEEKEDLFLAYMRTGSAMNYASSDDE